MSLAETAKLNHAPELKVQTQNVNKDKETNQSNQHK